MTVNEPPTMTSADHTPPTAKELAVIEHGIEVTPLKSGGRADWLVHTPTPTAPVEAPDFVAAMRQFFSDMDAEIDSRRTDPVALTQGLARIEAVMADVRYVRDRMRDLSAGLLDEMRVRRLTVEGVVTVEGSSSVNRSAWKHDDLFSDLLAKRLPDTLIDAETGEVVPAASIASTLAGELYGPSTAPRVTPIKNAGLTVEDYCAVDMDQEGKVVRTPGLRIVDNVVRRKT